MARLAPNIKLQFVGVSGSGEVYLPPNLLTFLGVSGSGKAYLTPNLLTFLGGSISNLKKPNNLSFYGADAIPCKESIIIYQIN